MFIGVIVMTEEVLKLEDIVSKMQDFINNLYSINKTMSREVVFAAMIVKKTIDILKTAEFTLKKYIISVQISLLRLLCDNCLAIQAALEIGLPHMMDIIINNQRVNNIEVFESQNMTDGYLKKLVAKEYKGFDKLYNFACEGVHFSKQALSGAFKDKGGKISMNIEVGNKELKDELIANNNQMIVLCKVIMDMLKRLCNKKGN